MLTLVLGLAVFFGAHSLVIFTPALRQAGIARLGPGGWKAAMGVLSLLGFVLIVVGYGWARQSPVMLYSPPKMLRHIALTLMLPVFPLLLAAYLPGRIRSAVKHPMLVAVKLWALAHLLANGTLGAVVLFGSFLAWAVIDRIAVKRRPGAAAPAPSGWSRNDVIAVAGGLVLYVAFVGALHLWLIGVSPLA